MNNNNFDNLGFIFKSSKIILKHDEESDYFNKKPEPIGFELCNFTDRNRVSVFKLTKENLLNSLNDILNKKNASKLKVDYSNTQKMLALNEGSPSKEIANFILKTI